MADRYAIDRELGRGGMATVYLARDLKHDRLVAIKVLRPDFTASVGSGRFLREIRTAAQLQRLRDRRHPVGEPEQVASADDTFVAECERVISAQNEAWMAKLTSDPE